MQERKNGPVRDSNPGPLAPKARIMPLDQLATPDSLQRILRTLLRLLMEVVKTKPFRCGPGQTS